MKPLVLKEAFLRAREMAAGDRKRFVEEVAGSDAELAEKLARMLSVDRAMAGPLDLDLTGLKERQEGELIAGRYRIVRRLPIQGSRSQVYVASDESLHGRRVALKFPLFEGVHREWLIEQFQRETRALASIESRHVVRIYDCGLVEGRHPFLVMQFVEGSTLRESVGKATSRQVAMARIQALASALDEVHRHGVLHLDIKPSNVMVRPDGEPVLIDFGVARTLGGPDVAAAATTVGGSSGYMAPEHRAGRPCVASDIYSFAILSWEMVTGRRPDPLADGVEWPGCLRRALHPDPVQRYGTAGEFAKALRRHLDRPRRWRQAGVALVCVLAGAGAWLWQRPGRAVELQTVLSVPGSESQPVASQNGNRMAFIGDQHGNDEVYVWDRGEGQAGPRRLTQTPQREDTPALSPDGAWIAYTRRGGGSAKLPALVLQRSEPGAPERVLLQDRSIQDISWHPNGRWILVASTEILAVSVGGDGGVHTVYADQSTRQGHPRVSRDGTLLGFTQSKESSRGSLVVAPLEVGPGGAPRVSPGTVPRVLVPALAAEPEFSVSGRELFYECGIRICRVGVAPGSQPSMVGLSRFSLRDPFPVPQGLLLSDNPEHTDIRIRDRNQADGRILFQTGVNERTPQYSPDGKWIAFISERSGAAEVWVVNASTLVSRQLTKLEGADAFVWSPDSTRLLISRAEGGEVVSVRAEDGAVLGRCPAPDEGDIVANSLAWAGRQTVYAMKASGGGVGSRKYELVKLDLARKTQEGKGMPWAREVVAIPGSEDLLVRSENRDLLRYSPGSGATALLAQGIARYRLAATASGVYYVKHFSNAESWMLYQAFGSRTAEKLFRESSGERWGYGLSVSPDGRSVLYTNDNRRSGDLVLAASVR